MSITLGWTLISYHSVTDNNDTYLILNFIDSRAALCLNMKTGIQKEQKQRSTEKIQLQYWNTIIQNIYAKSVSVVNLVK